jgi:uncharacterized phage protein gp47/JayE
VPTIQQIRATAAADIQGRLQGANALLRRTVFDVLTRMVSGVADGLYRHISFVGKQIHPTTSDSAADVERHASLRGLYRKPAWKARGQVVVTGTGTMLEGTQLQRADGVMYIVSAEVDVVGSSGLVQVIAVEPGSGGNAEAGMPLTFVSPVVGFLSDAVVDGDGLNLGSEAESDDSLKARTLLRWRKPPRGGNTDDYEAWALSKEDHGIDVTRAWPYPRELGPGTVTVRFMMDLAYGNGIPNAADVEAVQTYIDQVKPVTAEIFVVAPVADPITFRISGLNPAKQAVRDAVAAELGDLIFREAVPGGTILLSHIKEAISIAQGEHDHQLVWPTEDLVFATGTIATFAGVEWV